MESKTKHMYSYMDSDVLKVQLSNEERAGQVF